MRSSIDKRVLYAKKLSTVENLAENNLFKVFLSLFTKISREGF